MADIESVSVVKLVQWDEYKDALSKVRHVVFVEEKNVPLELEIDEMDPHYFHGAAFDQSGNVVATGRMLPGGKIGRMAVLQNWRGTGTGRALLDVFVEKARALSLQSVSLDAQIDAQGFYDRYGFKAKGDVFMDAGIEHISMYLILD